MRNLVMVALLATLCACETPYQEQSVFWHLGYTDELIAPGAYRIRVDGAGNDDEQRMTAHWHRRANELCGVEGYTGVPSSGTEEQVLYVYTGYGGYTQRARYPFAEGIAECR